eukprot:1880518-Prymnesium_polylepis.1
MSQAIQLTGHSAPTNGTQIHTVNTPHCPLGRAVRPLRSDTPGHSPILTRAPQRLRARSLVRRVTESESECAASTGKEADLRSTVVVFPRTDAVSRVLLWSPGSSMPHLRER